DAEDAAGGGARAQELQLAVAARDVTEHGDEQADAAAVEARDRLEIEENRARAIVNGGRDRLAQLARGLVVDERAGEAEDGHAPRDTAGDPQVRRHGEEGISLLQS